MGLEGMARGERVQVSEPTVANVESLLTTPSRLQPVQTDSALQQEIQARSTFPRSPRPTSGSIQLIALDLQTPLHDCCMNGYPRPTLLSPGGLPQQAAPMLHCTLT